MNSMAESRNIAAIILVTVVSVCGAMYWAVTSSQTEEPVAASMLSTTSQVGAEQGKKAGSVGSLIGGLEAKLAENPDDGKGWLLLAKSREHLGNLSAAREAYAHARELGMEDPAFEAKLNDDWLSSARQ